PEARSVEGTSLVTDHTNWSGGIDASGQGTQGQTVGKSGQADTSKLTPSSTEFGDTPENRLGNKNNFRKGFAYNPLPDMVEVGRKIYDAGKTKMADWANAMRRAIGTHITPWIKEAWAKMQGDLRPVEKIDYNKVVIPEDGAIDNVKAATGKYTSATGKLYAEVMRPISARLKGMSSQLWSDLRRYQHNLDLDIMKDKTAVNDWANKVSKIGGEDAAQLKNALLNSEAEISDAIYKKYDLAEMADTVNKINGKLRQDYIEAGGNIGEVENYSHRLISDKKGFAKAIDSYIDKRVESAIKAMEQKRGRTLEPAEKTKIYNSLLSSYRNRYLSFTPGAAKAREIEVVPSEFLKYYADPVKSELHYIETMRQRIAMRRFFGKESAPITQLRKHLSSMLTAQAKADPTSSGFTERAEKIELYKDYLARAADKDLDESIGAKVRKLRED
ncbi:MAG: hypothetical protein Q7T18_05920, partial [Sedimentisphaerales bacterium]|nr:hypothetical protein [Sedimentisphaerales bacterium]